MKFIGKIFVLIFLGYFHLSAQTSSISGTARVIMIKPLSITAINNTINFGEIILSGSAFVYNLHPSQGAIFKIEGHPNRNVVISYYYTSLSNAQWVSQNGGIVGSLNFAPNVVHTGSSSVFDLPQIVVNGGSYQLQEVNRIGILYVWVGGSLNIQANQPIGDYSGTFNITVTY
jgi:hypothetical protein